MYRHVLTNDRLSLTVEWQDGLFVRELSLAASDGSFAYGNEGELFCLDSDQGRIFSGDFQCVRCSVAQDQTEELVSYWLCHRERGLQVRVCLLHNRRDTVSVSFQMSDETGENERENYFFHSPFLAHIRPDAFGNGRVYYPMGICADATGRNVVKTPPFVFLPYVATDERDESGIEVSFPTLSTLYEAVQNRNVEYRRLSSARSWERHSLRLRLGRTLADVAEFSLFGLREGWREAFRRVKSDFRRELDLRQYDREALRWMRDTLIHHFTFLYSKEAYDYETDTVAVSRLLQDGDAFGGYDTVTLWHQYPRLGVDQRDQWDFYRDFPENKKGLRGVIDQLHENGVRVFLPYKPWDTATTQTEEETSKKMQELITETDADGFFLDTMNAVSSSFRAPMDAVKPETVFLCENPPTEKNALTMLTSSWDQYWEFPAMPQISLLRFLLPEHTAPQISRWQDGRQKDDAIDRAIFCGVGLVVWQDVFGSWMPYTEKQKKRIATYKAVWKRYRSCLNTPEPMPLYPTASAGVYCNYFPNQEGTGAILACYQEGNEPFDGFLAYNHTPFLTRAVCVLGDGELTLTQKGIEARLAAHTVTLFYLE